MTRQFIIFSYFCILMFYYIDVIDAKEEQQRTSHCGGYNHSTLVYALQECNYRHIDTAKRYGCEGFIAKAVEDSELPRDEVFLTTKLWPADYGYQATKQACSGSLDRLNTDYLDLYLLHWPNCTSDTEDPKQTLSDTWRAMEVLYDEEKCRSIGVSNFLIDHLDELLETCSIVPHVNQCEFHPYQNPPELRSFCQENNIQFAGYCPLANGRILSEPPIVRIASEVGRTPAQVLIRWSIQNDVITIPKSTKPHRVRENAQVFDFSLTPSQMKVLDGLNCDLKVIDRSSIQERIDSKLPDGYRLTNVVLDNYVPENQNN